mmetsp:Transcript_25518/g.75417  ORF Transcript_25518/g.75417 Transcript_25518/m.75417 type:complete len:215 (+) Transcript_25518:407-1051(+)
MRTRTRQPLSWRSSSSAPTRDAMQRPPRRLQPRRTRCKPSANRCRTRSGVSACWPPWGRRLFPTQDCQLCPRPAAIRRSLVLMLRPSFRQQRQRFSEAAWSKTWRLAGRHWSPTRSASPSAQPRSSSTVARAMYRAGCCTRLPTPKPRCPTCLQGREWERGCVRRLSPLTAVCRRRMTSRRFRHLRPSLPRCSRPKCCGRCCLGASSTSLCLTR